MLHVECSGAPYEVGHRHGNEAGAQVKGSLAFYEALFLTKSRLQWPAVCAEAEKWLPYLEAHWPDYIDEIKGLAAGSGSPFASILALNVRTEIAFGLSFRSSSNTIDGCTALSFHKGRTAILAQNWDWEVEQAPNLIHLTIRHPANSTKAPVLSFVTEAGIIGKIGLNSHGIGTCLNAIRAPGVSYARLPVHLALRAALDCDVAKLGNFKASGGLAETNGTSHTANGTSSNDNAKPSARTAAAILSRAGVASAAHILIADAEEGIGLETSSVETQRVPVEDIAGGHAVLHTNHFVVPGHKAPDVKDWFAGSSARLARIRDLMGSSGNLSTASVDHFLQDEQGYPFSICRDVDAATNSTVATVFSIVMDLGERKAKVKVGRPIKPSEEIELDARQ